MRTFIMGDIHGAYKALLQCLQQCDFDYASDTLIQLGDVADGHDEVYQCVEELLKIKHCIAIKGNHDEWFNEFILTGTHSENWSQGGKGTALSYLRLTGREDTVQPSGEGFSVPLQTKHIPVTHKRFFQQQQLYHIDDRNNCFIHAGFNRHLPFAHQPDYLYYWDRNLWTEAMSYAGFAKGRLSSPPFQMATTFNEIFIGHTSTTYWRTDIPMKAANIYNVDTGAGHTGKLTIMDLESKKYWQSDAVDKLYETNYR